MAQAQDVSLHLNPTNPLLINVVAENILQFVPLRHLKTCRLVCSIWWKESLARWRRTYWLKLSFYDLDAGRKESPHERTETMQDEIEMRKCLHIGVFISFLDNPRDPYKLRSQPFQKLKLFKCEVAFHSGTIDKLERFFTTSGPSVKFLSLEHCTIETVEDFRRIIFRFSPNLEYLAVSENVYKNVKLPRKNQLKKLNLQALVENESDVLSHLKYLKLSMIQFDTIPEDSLPLTWTEFFVHFPNVQNLEFENLDADPDKTAIIDIFKSIQALRTQCGILQKIKGLDLLNLLDMSYEIFDPRVRQSLRDVSLPLTFLSYDIGHEHIPQAILGLQLEIAAATLETLVIYKGPFSAPVGSFPYGNKFPNLTKLTLVGPIVNDLLFLKDMPALKIIRLFHKINYDYQNSAIPESKVITQLHTFPKETHYSVDYESVAKVPVIWNTDFSQMSHLSFPNIEEFLVGEEICTAENVEHLARLMPNVKRLRIGLDNEGFRALCKHWKGLEALDIHPVDYDDEGFTGIVPGEEIRLPNITDLKYLRAFGMSDVVPDNSTETEASFMGLSDFSLEQRLLQLKFLERVSLSCSMQMMSEENFEMLQLRFPPDPYTTISWLYPDISDSVSDGSVESDAVDSDTDTYY